MSKGQGALEYLLLIGGAVLLATIVIAILVSVSPNSNLVDISDADYIIVHIKNGESFELGNVTGQYLDTSKKIIINNKSKGFPTIVINPENISYVEIYKQEKT